MSAAPQQLIDHSTESHDIIDPSRPYSVYITNICHGEYYHVDGRPRFLGNRPPPTPFGMPCKYRLGSATWPLSTVESYQRDTSIKYAYDFSTRIALGMTPIPCRHHNSTHGCHECAYQWLHSIQPISE